MKLNNRGWSWGVGFFITCVVVAFIVLFVVFIILRTRLSPLIDENEQAFYNKLENSVTTSFKTYNNQNNIKDMITVKELIDNNYLNNLYDGFVNCTGYSTYKDNKYTSYIKCGSYYKTKGYNKSYDLSY